MLLLTLDVFLLLFVILLAYRLQIFFQLSQFGLTLGSYICQLPLIYFGEIKDYLRDDQVYFCSSVCCLASLPAVIKALIYFVDRVIELLQ